MKQYEVWCASCEVSFPAGAKRCMHCGARTQQERPAKYIASESVFSFDTTPPAREKYAPSREMTAEEEQQAVRFSAEGEAVEAVEAGEEGQGRRGLRAVMSIVWMLLLAAGYLWQSCAGRG